MYANLKLKLRKCFEDRLPVFIIHTEESNAVFKLR